MFQTIVVVEGPQGIRGGLASTLGGGHHLHDTSAAVRNPGRLTDCDPLSLTALARSPSLLEAAVGMAAVNALLEVDRDRCVEVNAADILAERGKGKRVVVDGVDAVSGTRLANVEAALRAVSEGATFRQVPGRQLLTLFR